MNLLEMNHVKKSFGDLGVIQDISLHVGEGEIVSIIGPSGSGKSTLLHTIISGLVMNYHPDELELWLLDFKMLEFSRYMTHTPPHVKYVLLEKSEEVVFDIIDRLQEILEERKRIFDRRHYSQGHRRILLCGYAGRADRVQGARKIPQDRWETHCGRPRSA